LSRFLGGSVATEPGSSRAAVAANPLLYKLPRVVLAVTAFVGLAAVQDLRRVFRHAGDRWLRWTSLLVVIGLALTGVSQARFALFNPERAALGESDRSRP
jgi:hypothetical protein